MNESPNWLKTGLKNEFSINGRTCNVDGSLPKPEAKDPANLTSAENQELSDWKRKTAKASGEIWLSVEDDQKMYMKEMKGDPTAMWRQLVAIHVQKKPGACFNAYDALFNVCKGETEPLTALMARADKAMQDINTSAVCRFKRGLKWSPNALP